VDLQVIGPFAQNSVSISSVASMLGQKANISGSGGTKCANFWFYNVKRMLGC
jgi:hypothetical protein